MAALTLAGGICLLPACSKPAPEPTATPTPAPTAAPSTPVAAATPTPTPEPTIVLARYNGAQQVEYMRTAQSAFIEARAVKTNAYAEANAAFIQAGGATAKGLTSKEAVTERRGLIDKVRQANEDYLTFVNTQNDTYKAELAKTPLTAADVDAIVGEFAEKSKAADVKKLREQVRDLLKDADDMMGFLGRTYGAWTLNGNKLAFKKPADQNQYAALSRKYNDVVGTVQKLQTEVNAPLQTPSETPLPSVGSGTTPAAAAKP